MAAELSFPVARKNLNTLDLSPRGHIWVRLLSPCAYPIGGFHCKLESVDETWESQEISREGEVAWHCLPLLDFALKLKLAGRTLEVPVPWLRTREHIHVQRLMNAKEILGPPDCPSAIQVRLNGLGYAAGKVDGKLGTECRAAVREFQRDRSILEDGDCGPATQSFLVAAFGA